MTKFYFRILSIVFVLFLSSCFNSERSKNVAESNTTEDPTFENTLVAPEESHIDTPLDPLSELEVFSADEEDVTWSYNPIQDYLPGQRVSYLYPISTQGWVSYPLRKGAVRVVTFLVNIDTLQSQDLTKDRVEELVFTGNAQNPFSINSFVDKASGGTAHLTGEVFGPYTVHLDADKNISNKSQYCDSVIAQVKEAARAQGFVDSNYPYGSIYLYMIPGNLWICSGCGSSAGGLNIAYVGGYKDISTGTSQNIAENAYSNYALIHEFGHALGLHHDSKMTCKHNNVPVPVGDDCIVEPYGDNFSVMGISTSTTMPAIFSAHGLAKMGWISPRLVTNSGNYNISPIDRPAIGGASQILQIPRGLSIKSYYYVSRRMDLIGVTVPDPKGVFVHLSRSHTIGQAYVPTLLKMHPDGTRDDVMLRVGETFTDPQTGIALTLNSVNQSGTASLSVIYPNRSNTAPSVPTGLSASVVNDTNVSITWNASTDSSGHQVNDYKLLINDTFYPHIICGKNTSSNVYSGVDYASSSCSQLKIIIGRLTNKVPLSIRVQARDINGNLSASSSAVSVKIPDGADITPPSAPSNFRIVEANTQGVKLAWDASTDDVDIAHYNVSREAWPTATTGWPLSWAYFDTTTSIVIPVRQPQHPTYPYLYEAGKTYLFRITATDTSGNTGSRSSLYVTIPSE